mgnify:CR=1 FL=1
MTTLHCPAKLNLYLAILEKDETGYHKLDTIFARLPEAAQAPDLLHIEPADKLEIKFIPTDSIDPANNTLTKALSLLEGKTSRRFSYKITLEKHIPIQSGLGGGSSDAATLLLHLNQAENLGLTQAELMELGTQIGKDAPFFLSGFQVSRGAKYGDQLTPLPSLPASLQIKIEADFAPTSTAEAFADWDGKPHKKAPSIEPLLAALHTQNPSAILAALHNDFEPVQIISNSPRRVRILAGSGGAHAVFCVVDN